MHVLVCICSNVRQFQEIIGMIQMCYHTNHCACWPCFVNTSVFICYKTEKGTLTLLSLWGGGQGLEVDESGGLHTPAHRCWCRVPLGGHCGRGGIANDAAPRVRCRDQTRCLCGAVFPRGMRVCLAVHRNEMGDTRGMHRKLRTNVGRHGPQQKSTDAFRFADRLPFSCILGPGLCEVKRQCRTGGAAIADM